MAEYSPEKAGVSGSIRSLASMFSNTYLGSRSPAVTAKHYELGHRATVYRHAHALGLFSKRQRNVRAALERIIEKAGEVDVSASAVVAAVQVYSKINSAGQWVDRANTSI
jgi:hypothetical protein